MYVPFSTAPCLSCRVLTAAGAWPQAEVFGMLHGQRLGTSPEPYLLVVLDLVLGAVGGWEARLLP